MKQTFLSLSVAGTLLALLLWGCLRLAQPELVARPPQTLAAPHSPAPQVTNSGLQLTARIGLSRNSCGPQATLSARIGTVVYYCYEIRNTTTQTLRVHTLDAPVVGDRWRDIDHAVAPGGTLNPLLNYNFAFSRVVTTTLVEPARWTASNPDTNLEVSAIATTTLNAVGPLNVGLTLGRTADCATTTSLDAPFNGRLYYCVTITNTTGITLTNHTFNLPVNRFQTNLIYVIPPSSKLVLTQGLLAFLGLGITQTLEQTILQAQQSTISVTSRSTADSQFTGSARVSWTVGQSSIDLIKTISLRNSAACPPTTNVVNVANNTPIYYCLRVRNTGLITLTRHSFVEPNTALGGPVISGQFDYLLAPGKTMTLTRANITSTPGLVFTTPPVLGPYFQPITATNTLTFTSTNAENFRATDTATGTLRLAGPSYSLVYAANSVDNSCALGSPFNLEVGKRIWFCLVVTNIGPIELTNHSFQLFVSPPKKQGERYNYTASGKFTHTLPTNAVMTLTNTFLGTKGLGQLMGPYTLTTPLTDTNRVTGTIIITSTDQLQLYTLVARATNNFVRLASFATATPTASNTPDVTATFTPLPGLTPTPTTPPTPTPVTPTPTPIIISPLPQPTPTPDLRVREVSAPVSQVTQPESPLVTQPGSDSFLATPTPFPLDPALVAATQTMDAALTQTAIATLQPPTPTFTETPSPTPLPTDTATPTETPTATPTQRPITAPTATAVPYVGITLPNTLQSILAVAGWIWFLLGVLAFFVAAGIVVGLGLRQREGHRYQLRSPPPVSPPTVPPASRPKPDEDHWPSSLP